MGWMDLMAIVSDEFMNGVMDEAIAERGYAFNKTPLFTGMS